MTNTGGQVVERYGYDVYGQPTVRDAAGTVLGGGSAYANRFLFTGREWLASAGVYDYRHRAYSPALGRFLQTDPINFKGADINLYRYVGNAPTLRTDPMGLYITYRGGGNQRFWDNYRRSYADMRRSARGRQLLDALENCSSEVNVGPSVILPDGTSLTGAALPGLTFRENGRVEVVLDTTNGLGDRLLIPHEFYHALEYTSGIAVGQTLVPDPLGWGTQGAYPAWDASGKESRAVRGANIMSSEFGGGVADTYGNRPVPYPMGGAK